jgi:hypothetical protein
MFGGNGAQLYGDVWALSLGGEGSAWTEVHPLGEAPPPRMQAAIMFDPVGDRMVVWGGRSSEYDLDLMTDTWALELARNPVWTRVESSRAPGVYSQASAAYDPWNRRMLLHVGRIVPTAYGGQEFKEDVWALTLSEPMRWDSLPAPPGLRGYTSHVALVDPIHRELITGCGTVASPVELWALSLQGPPTWRSYATTGGAPGDLSVYAMVSPERGSVIQFGPQASHELSLATVAWTSFSASEPAVFPPRRAFASIGIDQAAAAVLVFGGYDWWCREDLYRFALDSDTKVWEGLAVSGGPPNCVLTPEREWLHGTIVYDPSRNRLLQFFGSELDRRALDQVWTLPLVPPWTWSRLEITGPTPSGRFDYSLMFDPVRNRVLLFGGASRANPLDDFPDDRSDLWALSLDSLRWTQLPIPAGPDARRTATMLYDERRDRLLLLGGVRSTFRDTWPLFDAWTLPLGEAQPAWSRMESALPTTQPAVLDANRDRLLLWDQGSKLWSQKLSQQGPWQPLPMLGEWPVQRAFASVTFDPQRDQLVTFGGAAYESENGLRADLHALHFSRPVAVELLSGEHWRPGATLKVAILSSPDFSPDSVIAATVTLAGAHPLGEAETHARHGKRDVNGDGRPDLVLEFAGHSLKPAPGDTVLVLMGETPNFEILGRAVLKTTGARPRGDQQSMVPPAALGSSSELALKVSSPAMGGLTLRCTLPSDAPARIEVFDIAGRRVAVRQLGGPHPGTQALTITEAALRPGVFLVRLAQAGHSVVTRAVLVK